MKNQDLQSQIKEFKKIILQNPVIHTVLERTPELNLPNWYLGAGCLSQTVWNYYSNQKLQDNIADMDLVYFDSQDIGFESEDEKVKLVQKVFADIPVHTDLKNQARVHLWYKKHFGYSIKPYQSVEEAINTWPTTATSTAVKYDENGQFLVYAPFGLNDLLGMVVRANKIQITKAIYMKKIHRWKSCWPNLTIIPWN